MATKGQELKKELTQAFSGLKFSVKTKMVCKGNITEIAVTIKGLKDSDYTISEIKEITNKYHNWDWQTVSGDTNVVVNTDKETKEVIDNPVVETIQETKEVIDNPVVETIQETKEEPINNTVVKTVKEVTLQNKIAKLQTKLTRLNAQLRIAKGRQNQHKLIEKILKLEASIEQLIPKQKEITLSWEQQKSLKEKVEQLELIQEKPVDAPVTKKDEFCKKPEKATIKFLESKFKDAQIEITDKQVILKSKTSELKLNCFVEIPYIDEYYNHYKRKKLIKRLRDGQTSKAHSVCEYIGSILLTA